MGKRKYIGIKYTVDKRWIGGVYYIQNLILALSLLPDKEKPNIDVYTSSIEDFEKLKEITGYPFLEYQEPLHLVRWKWRVHRILNMLGLTRFVDIDYSNFKHRDRFYFPIFGDDVKKGLTWIPDFQHERLPEFFQQTEIDERRKKVRDGASRGFPVVLSSEDALNDYNKYFSDLRTQNFVLHFAVTLPDISDVSIDELRKQYSIYKKYYFCANQFWAHKNHLFLFEEFRQMLKQGMDVNLVCTGALYEYRDNEYIDKVKDILQDDLLKQHVKVLGFIPRKDMLCLMKNAEAVIQPSLFEGWSTVVEDAKALNQFVFLSDLPVHREQMNQNVCFFNPRESGDLAKKIAYTDVCISPYDYNQDRKAFAWSFLKIINDYKGK